jgi:pimeloyl-ACP methyl ester carboxylesterase
VNAPELRPGSAAGSVRGQQGSVRSREARQPPEVTAIRTQVWRSDGTWIPVWTSGSGPKLLIVHGEATNHASWDRVRRFLNARFTVISMDRRATFEYPFSVLEMEQEIRDVAAVANSLGEPLTILGHSSGALCALGAAPRISRLGHLVLYEPPLETGEHVGPALDRLDRLLRQGDMDGVVDTWLTDYLRLPADAAELIKHSEAGGEIRRFAGYLPREAAEHSHWRLAPEQCAAVGIPVTYLVGGNTPVDSREYRGMIAELEALIPDLRIKELPGERHFAHFSSPELLARTVSEILVPSSRVPRS